MRITSVTATPLEAMFVDIFGGTDQVPPHVMRPAAHFQTVRRLGQFSTLVALETDEGPVGLGEAFGLPHPSVAATAVDNVLAPHVTDVSLDELPRVLEELRVYLAALGNTAGPVLEALSALDIACWDLRAQAEDVSLTHLLGGKPGRLGAYASPVMMLPDPEDSRRAALGLVAEGFDAVKLKIGRGPATDLAHVEAVRDGLGPDRALMLDANCAYDVDGAIALGRAVERFDVAWLEEPVSPEDPSRLAAVRRACPVPIATGENEFSPAAFERLVRLEAADVLQPNLTRAGGVTGCARIAELCHDAGLRLAPHGVGGAVGIAATLHLSAAAPAFAVFEANRLPNPLRDELTWPRMTPVDGVFTVPQEGAGLGIALDEDALARWSTRAED